MEEIIIRFWQLPDLPDLREIFTVSFKDPPEIVEAFFRTFLNARETCLLAAVPETGRPEGRPVAAAYCLPGPALCFSERQIPSAYLYAFACMPLWRGRGIMKQVYTALFETVCSKLQVSSIIPVSEDLLRAYNRTGFTFVPLGRIRSARISVAEARAAEALQAERLPWQEYVRCREEWLKPYPHAAYPDPYYSLAAEYGNVYLSLPGALAAVIPLGNRCVVSELLCPSAEPAGALAGIAADCPAEQYEIRTPVFFPGPGEIRPFAYYHAAAEDISVPEEFWYPFGLE